jgi:hypothetical protein
MSRAPRRTGDHEVPDNIGVDRDAPVSRAKRNQP